MPAKTSKTTRAAKGAGAAKRAAKGAKAAGAAKGKKYAFNFRTGKVIIDHSRCPRCKTYDCAKACRLYGAGILKLEKGLPVLNVPPDEAERRDNECLACEQVCPWGAITIELTVKGLDDWESKAAKGKARA